MAAFVYMGYSILSIFSIQSMLLTLEGKQLQPDLLLDEGHDADSREDRLATQTLPRDAVRKRLSAVSHRLAQVTHEEGHVSSGEEDR